MLLAQDRGRELHDAQDRVVDEAQLLGPVAQRQRARVAVGDRLAPDAEEALEAAQPHLELEQLARLAGGGHLLGPAAQLHPQQLRAGPGHGPLRALRPCPSRGDHSTGAGVDPAQRAGRMMDGRYLEDSQTLESARFRSPGRPRCPAATSCWRSPRWCFWSSWRCGTWPRSPASTRRWTALFKAIGSVWTAVLLLVIYVVSVGPVGLVDAARRQRPARPPARPRALVLAQPRAQPARPRAGRAAPVLIRRCQPDSTYVLGISCFYHDSAAALLKDGVVIAAGQEERFTPQAPRLRLPGAAPSATCSRRRGITPEQLDAVGFYDKPLLKFERMLSTYIATFPRSFNSFRKAMPVWLHEKLWVPAIIRKELKPYKGPILFAEHHMSHAASAFLPSPFEEAAILTIDGVGEWATASLRRRPRHGHRDAEGDPLPAQRSACSTAPSPTTSASRSTAPSTR